MVSTIARLVLAVALLASCEPRSPLDHFGDDPIDAHLDVSVPTVPGVLRADNRSHVVYELHVTNFGVRPVRLKRIEVIAGTRTLDTVEGDTLATSIKHPGVSAPSGDERFTIAPGTIAVVFMWIIPDGDVPANLAHRITVDVGASELVTTTSEIRIGSRSPRLIAAPLRGSGWEADNVPSNTCLHRRALIAVGGKARISQRYAIDWGKVGADGNTFTGDPSSNASYHAYGEPVLAVSDGVVTEVVDGIPENTPGDTRAVPMTLSTVGGNHIIIDLGDGAFGFWGHLQPGSIKVKVGDRVTTGQPLGLLGNSGNSYEPHLHFHVTDGNSLFASEGVPYAFERYDVSSPKRETRTHQLPSQGDVVTF